MRQSSTFTKIGIGAIAVALIVLAGSACTVKTASDAECSGENRPAVDCSSEVSYQEYKAEGGFGIMNLAKADAKYDETALRRINDTTERFITVQARLCRDYNACALDKDQYDVASKEIREILEKVPALVDKVKAASSDVDRVVALDSLYRYTVPDEERVEEVALTLALEADLPPEVGGQRIMVRPGAPLPTEARAWFWVETMPEAYVYIFQKSAKGDVSVLFPDERIGTSNPLKGQTRARIPNGDLKFRINDKDLGIESVYFAASRKPLATLDAAFARVREGKTTTISQDKLLSGFDSLPATGSLKDGCRGFELERCPRMRGFELDMGRGFAEGRSIGAITEPGDDLIVFRFTFEHTTLAAYPEAAKRYTEQGPKSRGSIMLERNQPRSRGSIMLEKYEKPSSKTRGSIMLE